MNSAIRDRSADRSTPEQVLKRVDWQVVRRLDGILQGDYRGLFYGSGLDFADLREYQPEDDVRSIDWNVTARMNTPYVRQYIEDREVSAWFLLDLSPSMAFGAREQGKQSVLVDFVAALGHLLSRSGNRVGAIFFNNGTELTIPPVSGRAQILRIIGDLQSREPSTRGAMTDLTPLLQHFSSTVKRRSLVFLVSDFICEPGWSRYLSWLSRRHELVPVRLWDPREVELPNVGYLLVEDSETGEQFYVDTGDRKFRQRFNDAAKLREQDLRDNFKRAGVSHMSLSTEEDLVGAILRFVAIRKRMLNR